MENINFELAYKSSIPSFNGDGEKVKKFLLGIMKNFAVESFNFYEEWNEFPFVYGEKQVCSALIPAIYNDTKTIWLEQPFKSQNSNQRFLDIVTSKKDHIYFIELKHAYHSKTKDLSERALDEWDTAIRQIESIKQETIGDFYEDIYKKFKIAFMIMPHFLMYKGELQRDSLQVYNEDIVKLFNDSERLEEYGYANFVGTIEIKEYQHYVHEFEKGKRKEVYPFVSFIARVERV